MSSRFLQFTQFSTYMCILISVFSIRPVSAADLQSKDIILSANGAAGSQDWEYNAAKNQGWVQHTINWKPTGHVSKVQWRCVDNCGDNRKFEYRIKFDNGQMVLLMKATTGDQGLIRLQLTALVD